MIYASNPHEHLSKELTTFSILIEDKCLLTLLMWITSNTGSCKYKQLQKYTES